VQDSNAASSNNTWDLNLPSQNLPVHLSSLFASLAMYSIRLRINQLMLCKRLRYSVMVYLKSVAVLDSHQVVHGHKQRINNILLSSSPELAMEMFGLDKPRLKGFTMSTNYGSLFNIKYSELITKIMWIDVESMMEKTLEATLETSFIKNLRRK
jgi:hypothetical protein